MGVRKVDLANWALRTSPKFTTGQGLNVSSIMIFDQIRDIYTLLKIKYVSKLWPEISDLYWTPIMFSDESRFCFLGQMVVSGCDGVEENEICLLTCCRLLRMAEDH